MRTESRAPWRPPRLRSGRHGGQRRGCGPGRAVGVQPLARRQVEHEADRRVRRVIGRHGEAQAIHGHDTDGADPLRGEIPGHVLATLIEALHP